MKEKARDNEVFIQSVLAEEGPLSNSGWSALEKCKDFPFEDNLKLIDWDGFLFRMDASERLAFIAGTVSKSLNDTTRLPRLSDNPLPKPGMSAPNSPPNISIFKFEATSLVEMTPSAVRFHVPQKWSDSLKLSTGKISKDVFDKYRFVLSPCHRYKTEWKDAHADEKARRKAEPLDPSDRKFQYLNYSSEDDDKPMIQVLLVRNSTFKDFVTYWGATHVIIELPETMKYRPDGTRLKFGDTLTFNCVDGGVGFARLFGQLWAYQVGIEYCHFWDDNVVKCFELQPDFQCREVSFSRVMQKMETVLTMDQESLKKEGERLNYERFSLD